jgi:peroxiredoxin
MTDLVIKGIKIPDRQTIELMRTELACVSRDECDRHCENCDLVQDKDGLIAAFHEAIMVLEAVSNAIILPERYGKLIDADKLKKLAYEIKTNRGTYQTVINIVDLLNTHPIIPAEGGKE